MEKKDLIHLIHRLRRFHGFDQKQGGGGFLLALDSSDIKEEEFGP